MRINLSVQLHDPAQIDAQREFHEKRAAGLKMNLIVNPPAEIITREAIEQEIRLHRERSEMLQELLGYLGWSPPDTSVPSVQEDCAIDDAKELPLEEFPPVPEPMAPRLYVAAENEEGQFTTRQKKLRPWLLKEGESVWKKIVRLGIVSAGNEDGDVEPRETGA